VSGSDFVDVDWAGRTVRIEHQWIPGPPDQPLIVLVHEGLGSVSMWRDFPARLCEATRCRGLVYSRPGYGRSTPRAANERWGPDFMHRQAREVLPSLLMALGLDTTAERFWLFGHSDGASISLIYATKPASGLKGCIVLAPHIMVEDITIRSIRVARAAYERGDLRSRLARHHDDPDSAFYGWNDAWLDQNFHGWSIEAEISSISCPILAVQGLDDEYGSLEQIRGIRRRLPQTSLLELARFGHSPHRDQPGPLLAASAEFIASHP
jgi:pimeloyl-ACP methyl ester carboxylesterase